MWTRPMLTQEEEGKEFGEKREGGRTKFLQFEF
jgi:hypothetical protein